MKKLFIFFPILLLAACQSLPRVDFRWPESEKDTRILLLQEDLRNSQNETQKIIEEKTAEIVAEETSRISLGTAQVYAAHGTLGADPEPNKYVTAASGALNVAKEALPIPRVEDLLGAIEIQKKLLSEQAIEIEEGKKLLEEASNEVVVSKNKAQALEAQKVEIEKKSKETEKILGEELATLEVKRDAERQKHLNEINSQAEAWKKENGFWQKINPLNGLARTFSSLMFWVVLLVVVGGGLKIASIMFPGVSIIQAIVGGIGRVFGGLFGMLFKWIPDALRGMGAVDYKEFKVEKQIADHSVGAIQELKYEAPEIYATALKSKLEDWNKDNPELKPVIDQKLKSLNLV